MVRPNQMRRGDNGRGVKAVSGGGRVGKALRAVGAEGFGHTLE